MTDTNRPRSPAVRAAADRPNGPRRRLLADEGLREACARGPLRWGWAGQKKPLNN